MILKQVKELVNVMDEHFDRFFDFIKEREEIRILKAKGAKRPWTQDLVFSCYPFHNVHHQDRSLTCLLMKEFYVKNSDKKSILIMCAFARLFRDIDFILDIGWIDYSDWDSSIVLSKYRTWLDSHFIYVHAPILLDKLKKTLKSIDCLHKRIEDIIVCSLTTKSLETTCFVLSSIAGFSPTNLGTRMMLQDAIILGFWDGYPKDYDTWVYIKKTECYGAALIVEKPKKRMKSNDALDIIHRISSMQTEHYPYKHLFAVDIAEQLGEFYKYECIKNGVISPNQPIYIRIGE